MTAVKKLALISVEDYLAGELESPIKHEYIGGVVHAMAGARIAHHAIGIDVAKPKLLAHGLACEHHRSADKQEAGKTVQVFHQKDVPIWNCRR